MKPGPNENLTPRSGEGKKSKVNLEKVQILQNILDR